MQPPPQGCRAGWRPASDNDFGDGGAFPEIHEEQYPAGIGRTGDLVPLTFMSGFLGSGKTTTLKHVLENQEGKRVGIIVNDVAEVNIDAKLIRKKRADDNDVGLDLTDTVELENGCACCTAGGDLMDSILKLIRLSIRRGYRYDRIVVEMSGVSEPKNLREDFLEAQDGHQMFKYCELQTMLTVVDSSHFLELYVSKADIREQPDLVMSKFTDEQHIDCERRIVDLLVEMVECADYIVLNKVDRVSEDHLQQLMEIITAFNSSAGVVSCTFGKVPLDIVLGAPQGKWCCKTDEEDDIKRAVKAARGSKTQRSVRSKRAQADPDETEESSSAFGGLDLPSQQRAPHKPKALPSRQQTTAASRFGITSFVYSRRRPFHPQRLMDVIKLLPVKVDAEGHVVDKWELPDALAPGAMAVEEGGACKSEDQEAAAGKAMEVAGKDEEAGGSLAADKAAIAGGGAEKSKNALHSVIRSKGFVWLANYPQSAHYWSHAGHYFSLESLGIWWVTTALSEWPKQRPDINKVLEDFDRGEGRFGDRRQEIVFIGIDLDQDVVEELLDACLLSDAEMQEYLKRAKPNAVHVDFTSDPPQVLAAGAPSA